MKIANVNAGNRKLDWTRLRDWLKGQRQRPDIVTLQKIGPSEPPHEEELRNVGYKGWYLDHKKNYLGVAILAHRDFLSRHGLSPPKVIDCELPGDDEYEPRFPNEARFLTVCIGNLWISSVYAPFCGKGLDKRMAIERRVAWLNRLRDHVRGKDHERWMLCGDFNVKADGPPWKKGYSECEWRALDELLELGFSDLYRKAHPDPEAKPGRTRGYDTHPEGTSRLHLILASESLARRLQSACVEVESKPWPLKGAPALIVELDDT